MPTHSRSGPVAGFALFVLALTTSPALAQTNYFWNAPNGGTGTWDTTTQNWSIASGGPADYTWTNSGLERANFGDTAGTVTLSAPITAYGLNFAADGYTVTGNTLTLAGTGGPISVSTGTATINSIIAGNVGLAKSGAGVLVLGGANIYTGGTGISAGTLRLGAADRLPSATAVTIATGATLDLNNFNQTIGSLASAGNVALGTGTLTIGANNTSTSYSGTVTGSGTLIKSGTGTFTFTGTWTGPLTVNQGVFAFGATGNLGSTATGLVTLEGGTLRSNNTGSGGGTFLSPNREIAIGSNGGTIDYNPSNPSFSIIFRGRITGAGNTLTKTGAGEFRVDTAVANNTFAKLVVNQGLFRVGATGPETGFGAAPASPLADAITLNGGAIGTSAGMTLNANRGITLGAAGGTINVTAASLTIPGVITGNGGLTVLGDAATDVLTLSGANNYAGATTITASTLRAGAANTLSSASAIALNGGTLSTGATTGFDQNTGALSVLDSSTIALGTGSHTLTFASFGTLAAGETLTITGWQGVPETSGTAGRIIFTNTSGLTPGVLAGITFTGSPLFGTGSMLLGNELVPVPVPEPATTLAIGAAGLGLIRLARRRAARQLAAV